MASFENRGHSVRAVVSIPGSGKKSRTFDTRAEAEAWAAQMEAKKATGKLTAETVTGATVGDLFDLYADTVATKTDTGKANGLRLRKWAQDPLAAKRLTAVTTHDINEWIERRAKDTARGKPISDATVNRELNLMSGAFNYAVKSKRWIDTNPCHGAARPERGKPRDRAALTANEIKALRVATGYDRDSDLATATARVGACFLLALETGMRSGEILRIKLKHYKREARTVFVAAEEKGGRKGARSGRASLSSARNVPLTDEAIRILDQLAARLPKDADEDSYIAQLTDDQRDALWRAARDRAGVADLRFHDTKHEAATRLAKFLDVFELSHALGTKDIRLLRDTYYINDASAAASKLPSKLSDR